jgi:hypothetical protein
MSSSPKLVTIPAEVDARLFEIGGLTRGVLTLAALMGEQARENTPRSFPVTAPGTNAYFSRVGSLRDQLRADGWKGKCVGGSELTIAPDESHAIVVASGDENTASETATPKTKTKKGRRMKDAAAENWGQMHFLLEISVKTGGTIQVAIEEGARWLTWVFLVARADKKLLMELSLVSGLGKDKRGASWLERIILPDVPLDGEMGVGVSNTPRVPASAPEIVVNVTRKNA